MASQDRSYTMEYRRASKLLGSSRAVQHLKEVVGVTSLQGEATQMTDGVFSLTVLENDAKAVGDTMHWCL